MVDTKEKCFLAEWGSTYSKPSSQKVGIEFFTDDLGYGEFEREDIDNLGIGESCLLDAGDHKVTRIA